MTWTSTMSSGYSSLEDDSEEFFFTARTSFFKKPHGKPTDCKVNKCILCCYSTRYYSVSFNFNSTNVSYG